MPDKNSVGVCATCPWRTCNQRKKHPANWYTLTNLKRLWNGIRKDEAHGMTCHSTDPESRNYGATKQVPETATPRECGGLILLVARHFKEMEDLDPTQYRRAYPKTHFKPAGISPR